MPSQGIDFIHISRFVQDLELPASTSLTTVSSLGVLGTTRESRGRSRPAESCFVLKSSLMMLIECVMKIRCVNGWHCMFLQGFFARAMKVFMHLVEF